jgi:hypothetical protein
MECVRQIVDSKLLDKIHLPRNMRGRKVEIIIMPVDEISKRKKKPIDNLIGILQHNANPELMHLEKGAWAKAMEAKHADC